MAVGVQKAWSTTASSNGSADTNVNFAEGQLAPTLNNSSRAAMAAIKGWANQIAGGCTCAGSSNAYTITSDAAAAISSAYGAGMMFMLKANHTNTGAATLNVDSVGAVAIKTSDGGDVVAGDIVSGGLYLLAYNATGPRFDLIGTFAGGSFQPLDATLTAVAGLSFSTTNAFFRATDVDTFVAESASNFRSALGLGTAALATIGTSGDTVPKNNTANTFSAAQTFGVNPTINAAGAPSGLFVAVAGALRTFLGEANAGQIDLLCYSDAGSFLGSALSVVRATQAVNFTQRPTVAAVNIVTVSSADTLSNKTLTTPTINGAALSGTLTGSPTLSGDPIFSGTPWAKNIRYNRSSGDAATSSGPQYDIDGTIYGRTYVANDLTYVIDAAGVQARVATSSEASGTLTTTSANRQIDATGGITIPASVFSAGDIITIYAGSASRTLTQGGGGTQRLHGSSTTGNLTLAARGVAGIRFISSTEWVVTGDVS